MNPARPPIFPTPSRTLRLRTAKGVLRHPVTGRGASDLTAPVRTPSIPSPDWSFQ